MTFWKRKVATAAVAFLVAALAAGRAALTAEAAGEVPSHDEHPGIPSQIPPEEIEAAIQGYLKGFRAAETDHVILPDRDDHDRQLELKFLRMHNPPHTTRNGQILACVDFQLARGDKGQIYDLDFSLNRLKGGGLQVTSVKIHKEPLLEWGRWLQKARFVYRNDQPVAVTSETVDWY